jgi:hypothetical protein
MTPPINQGRYESVPRPLGAILDANVTVVTLEETGRTGTRKILLMKFIDSEKKTRCVGFRCDENDQQPIENTLPPGSPGTLKGSSRE